MDGPDNADGNALMAKYNALRLRAFQIYQTTLDQSVPHFGIRWAATSGLLVLFMLRIVYAQGWYIIAYGLGIYLLNLFLAFLTPKFDPSLEQEIADEDAENGESNLPTRQSDEYKPFIRRLPEFKFWLSATKAAVLSFFMSWVPIFDIPVFWPILLMYFIVLFFLTMRRQIQHMVKYKYIPFDLGKAKFSSN
ncbi:rer1 protein-like protein [Protomyces lactucae-debilis]|uniref:Protein RER1 n=1 Tax=Protomyces lactucae-debilis TaxID=2754530 RepID=A0A1Y2FLX5_PROLT|nr:rer1 protein-like protein [Protomyces lactucae-debilis]ORY84973.1 rer1 protein-like protein [Protomyces lactucae-debilis]